MCFQTYNLHTLKDSTCNQRMWLGCLNHLADYERRSTFCVADITPKWLEGFQRYLLTEAKHSKTGERIAQNTACTYYHKLVAMLNQTDNSPSVSGEGNIRYWEDVSATGGGLDFLENPDEHSIMRFSAPTFHDCTDAVNIYGDSMYPIYKNGEIIVLKEWRESFIDYGYCYLIITRNGNRMVKYLRRSDDESKVLCMSEHPKYDPFEILKEDILRLYIVKGSLRKDTL